jgi:hypothetical protein
MAHVLKTTFQSIRITYKSNYESLLTTNYIIEWVSGLLFQTDPL